MKVIAFLSFLIFGVELSALPYPPDSSKRRTLGSWAMETYVLQNKYNIADGNEYLKLHWNKVPNFGIGFSPDINSGLRDFITDSNGVTSVSSYNPFQPIRVSEDYAHFYAYRKREIQISRRWILGFNGGLSYSLSSSVTGILFRDVFMRDSDVLYSYNAYKRGYDIDTVHQLTFYHQV